MKYILAFIGVGAILLGIFLFGGKTNVSEDYMRIHVVANSNSNFDQNIKYVVKDAVVEYLSPRLENAQNKEDAKEIILKHKENLQSVTNLVLHESGAKYTANICVTHEDFPTRAYGKLVLEEGLYDVLQINLGEAKGDNWWCVVFPTVCFRGAK